MGFGPTQHGPTLVMSTHIYIADMRMKGVSKCTVTSEQLVKIVNSNVMPTLRGFRWYPYIVSQE